MTAQSTNVTPIRSAFAPILAAGRVLVNVVAATSHAARCAREAERLLAMSDSELAKLGLRRDQIVQYAFQPYMGA